MYGIVKKTVWKVCEFSSLNAWESNSYVHNQKVKTLQHDGIYIRIYYSWMPQFDKNIFTAMCSEPDRRLIGKILTALDYLYFGYTYFINRPYSQNRNVSKIESAMIRYVLWMPKMN